MAHSGNTTLKNYINNVNMQYNQHKFTMAISYLSEISLNSKRYKQRYTAIVQYINVNTWWTIDYFTFF